VAARELRDAAQRAEQLGQREALVERHQHVAHFVGGGVERNREIDGHGGEQIGDARHHARGRDGDAARRHREALRVQQRADRLDYRVQVEQRLAHPHEHHVGDAPLRQQLAHAAELVDDLGRAEVAPEAECAGGAERASQRAADLGRDAERGAVLFGDRDRLEHGAVPGGERRLERAVGRALDGSYLERSRLEARGQRLAQLRREVGHRERILDCARVEPARQRSARHASSPSAAKRSRSVAGDQSLRLGFRPARALTARSGGGS
jgi:hypothetical protein